MGVFPLSPLDAAAAQAYQLEKYGAATAAADALGMGGGGGGGVSAAAAGGGAAAALAAGAAGATGQGQVLLVSLSTGERRAQTLWPGAALLLAQEVLNRRLFSEVNDKEP
jgi:hypothetical protein